MTKHEMIRRVAAESGITQPNVEKVLEAYSQVVFDTLLGDDTEKVVLPNLGSFKVKEIKEKSGVSNFSGEKWTNPAHKKLYFKLSSMSKETIA